MAEFDYRLIEKQRTLSAKKKFSKRVAESKYLLLLMLPGLIYYVIFRYGPMFGLVISFVDYNYYSGLFGSKFVGLKYFIQFVTNPRFFAIFSNTIIVGFLNVAFVLPVAMLFAIFLNELKVKSVKTFTQSLSLLPFFIANVVIIGITIRFLSPSSGVVNHFIEALGGSRVNFLSKPEWFRPLYVITEIYQRNGWFAVIFTAAILQIDPQLYESASMDGAGRFRKIISITLPSIIPIVVVMFILQIGRVMNLSFEKALLLQNPLTYETSDILDTYIYRRGLLGGNISYGTAVGFFKGLLGLFFIFTSNYLSRRFTRESIW